MCNEPSSQTLQVHPGRQTGLNNPHDTFRLFSRRRVHLLKPLQEKTVSPVSAFKTNHSAARVDIGSDCVEVSPLSFSPTSVLPQQRQQGNLCKALKLQADKAAAIAAGANSHAVEQHQLGSWADNQVIHNISGHTCAPQPLPGAAESALSGPISIHHQVKPKPPQAPVINRGSTLDAAWRWKFKRLWAREQLKYHFPGRQRRDDDDDEDAGNDPWHDALHMIQAANTTPAAGVPICDHDRYADPSPSPLLDDDDLDGLLEIEPARVTKAAAGAPEILRSSSSRALAEAASKARELLKYQVRQHLQMF